VASGQKSPVFSRVFGRRYALLALAVLCGGPPLAHAQDGQNAPVPIRVGYFKGSALAVQIALREGEFAQQGVDIHLVPLQAGPAILMAAAQGGVDIAYGDTFAFASAIRNGFTNLKLITPANGIAGWLVAAPGHRIAGARDLAGKRVGVTPTPFPAALIRNWVAQNGGDPNSIRFSTVPIGGQVAALRTGDLDAVFSFEFLTTRRLQQAGGTVLADLRTGAPAEAPAANYYASDDFISRHPDAVRIFVALVRKAATQFEAAPPEEKVRLQGAAFGLDYQALNKEIPGLLDAPDWGENMTGPINQAAAQAWIDIGVREKALSGPVDIGPYLFWTATTSDLTAPPKPR
jgi:NitT/TauT family transport system substrate-binding protein